ncbi:MAG: diphthamide biosynthesis enzyme Dph2 [Candidatus Micrarchaeia archaeon]|jgi:2-(3-amino-3-carboxypropyl)histidine synthase
MKILLQFPEGLKQHAFEFAKKYTKQGDEVFFSASPCYGGCDIALEEAKAVGAKKIIHFGHARFVKKKLSIPVEYVPYELEFDIRSLESILQTLEPYKKIAIGTTIQYSHKIKEIKKFFESNGKIVFVGRGTMAIEDGQILGCDAFAVTQFEKECEIILFIGDGQFHYLAIDSNKPVFVFHPKSKQLKNINGEIEMVRKRRRGAILKALECKTFGIIVSTKPGQSNPEAAKWAKKELEKRKKTVALLVANEIEPLALNNFLVFDCYVTTACPRIAEDREEFTKPVLDMKMLSEVLELMDELKK